MKTETAITNLKTIADNLKYECSRQELRGYANSIKKYIDAIEENLASDVNTGVGQLTIPDVVNHVCPDCGSNETNVAEIYCNNCFEYNCI